MATYLKFGTLTQAARNAVSVKRTEDARALIRKHAVRSTSSRRLDP